MRKPANVKSEVDPKSSIFKGPVNQDFFSKVNEIEDGIQIVTNLAEEEGQDAIQEVEENDEEKEARIMS